MKRRISAALAAAVISTAMHSPATAQNQAVTLDKDDTGRVLMTWEQFKKVTEWDAKQGDATKGGGEFVIPWSEIQALLGVEIKDVGTAELKLPWKEFKTLLEWSVKEAAKEDDKDDEVPVPVPYLISSSSYVGTGLSKEGASFTGSFSIDVLEKKGWKKIPVLPASVAVSKAELPEGLFLIQESGFYQLMTRAVGHYDIDIEFSVAAAESGGSHVLSFNKVASGSSVLDVTVPQKDVKITVNSAQSTLKKQVNEGTRLVAALPSTAPVYVQWERAIADAEVVPPKLYSETRTLVSVADGLFLGQAQVSFSILHTPTRELELSFPEGVSVLDVTGRDLRDWRVNKGALTVQLERDVIGAYQLDVRYESPLAAGTKTASVPVITAKGVEREKGHVGVVALTNVEIKSAGSTGATMVDVKGLPAAIPGMTSQPVLLGYRYVEPEFGIQLEISKHSDINVLLTVVDSANFTTMQTIDGRRITRGVYHVRNNRNQFLRLKLPEGAELWSATVAGKATQPATDSDGRVLLPLVRSQNSTGMSSFPVELVYAEQGVKPSAKGSGEDEIILPVSSEPVMHVTMELYLPKQGRYRDFGGTMREVEEFSKLRHAQAAPEIVQLIEQSGQQVAMNQVFNVQQRAVPGEDAVKVNLPLDGTVVRFEKILSIQDKQNITFEYSNLRR